MNRQHLPTHLMEELLLRQIIDDTEQCRRIGGDRSTFLALVREYGPVEACKVMIADPTKHDLLRLKQFGRLDLTVEALVLRDKFKFLFDDDVLKTARRRLVDHG